MPKKSKCRSYEPQTRDLVYGTCLWFSDKRGYGFLLSDKGRSCMVHYKNIKEHGFKRLYTGQRVTYQETLTAKGLLAINVKYVKDLTFIQKENRNTVDYSKVKDRVVFPYQEISTLPTVP
ncbi:MAG: cold-shock protein [[Clostridium] innocuum]